MTSSPKTAPNKEARLEIEFKEGLPVKVTDLTTQKTYESALETLTFLNLLGGQHGVGRIDIVENRFVGLKSRGVYETPGGSILYAAHHDLEVFCLDREVFRVTSYLRDRMADYVYNGFWFSPETGFVRKCLEESQKTVTGKVVVEIYKGHGDLKI
jgi:argininosuccinate synthase